MGAQLLIQRASWTLIDQGVVSFGNFLLNVLLARTLSEEDYGEFALFLGAIFILRTIDYSLISYPLSVRLCAASDEERARLIGNSILLAVALKSRAGRGHGAWNHGAGGRQYLVPGVPLLLVLAGAGDVAAILLADFRYRAAVAGDGIAYVGQAMLIALLAWFDDITLPAALYMMSATFGIGAMMHASKLRYVWPDAAEARQLAREYFSIGKWSLVNYQLVLVRVQLLPWMLAAFAGTAATASLQAGLNIANMMNPIIFGIGNAIPQVAAHAYRTGARSVRRARLVAMSSSV